MKLTKPQIAALDLINDVRWNKLTKRQVTMLTKASFIESDNGKYSGLTELGARACSWAAYYLRKSDYEQWDTWDLWQTCQFKSQMSINGSYEDCREEYDSEDDFRDALIGWLLHKDFHFLGV